jgi:hypothetical protein
MHEPTCIFWGTLTPFSVQILVDGEEIFHSDSTGRQTAFHQGAS